MDCPKSGLAVDLIKGDFGVADDSGSGGPAAISVSTYGYQSVNLDNDTMSVDEWVSENPNAKWVIEVYRDGEMIGSVATDSQNVTGRAQVQPPDGSRQYGNGIWWANLLKPDQFQIGDQWVVYGWNDMNPIINQYPPERFVDL